MKKMTSLKVALMCALSTSSMSFAMDPERPTPPDSPSHSRSGHAFSTPPAAAAQATEVLVRSAQRKALTAADGWRKTLSRLGVEGTHLNTILKMFGIDLTDAQIDTFVGSFFENDQTILGTFSEFIQNINGQMQAVFEQLNLAFEAANETGEVFDLNAAIVGLQIPPAQEAAAPDDGDSHLAAAAAAAAAENTRLDAIETEEEAQAKEKRLQQDQRDEQMAADEAARLAAHQEQLETAEADRKKALEAAEQARQAEAAERQRQWDEATRINLQQAARDRAARQQRMKTGALTRTTSLAVREEDSHLAAAAAVAAEENARLDAIAARDWAARQQRMQTGVLTRTTSLAVRQPEYHKQEDELARKLAERQKNLEEAEGAARAPAQSQPVERKKEADPVGEDDGSESEVQPDPQGTKGAAEEAHEPEVMSDAAEKGHEPEDMLGAEEEGNVSEVMSSAEEEGDVSEVMPGAEEEPQASGHSDEDSTMAEDSNAPTGTQLPPTLDMHALPGQTNFWSWRVVALACFAIMYGNYLFQDDMSRKS